jgi:hypothetical protein
MRIGILTHHWVYNFGANLQALATSRYLGERGHEVWILNYRPQAKEDGYRRRVSGDQANAHERFCNDYLRQSPLCRSEEQLVDFCRRTPFDAIWVGSDAMFRLRNPRSEKRGSYPNPDFPNPYWLQWAKASLSPAPLTGSLAASAMGTNYFMFPGSVRRGIRDAVRDMDHVTVRDRWTQLMLLAVSGGRCRPALCPDPVFILNDVFQVPEEYSPQLAAGRGQYLLLSVGGRVLSKAWLGGFVRLAHEKGLPVVSLPFPEGEVAIPVDQVIPLPLSPLSWYALMQNAAGFVGERMHPVICSMVNGVPFVSFDTHQRGRLRSSSKTYDLCARARVSNLCVSGRKRQALQPEEVLQMLHGQEQGRVKEHVKRAKCDFSRAVDRLLIRPI